LKVCLRTYYIAGHLKQPRGTHAARGLGSLGLDQGSPNFIVRGPHKLLHDSSRARHLT